jgi:hypothetical protein
METQKRQAFLIEKPGHHLVGAHPALARLGGGADRIISFLAVR